LPKTSGPKTHARELNPSKAWAKKIPTLTRPITALTVSIIANILATPHTTERLPRCTVKKIQMGKSKIGSD